MAGLKESRPAAHAVLSQAQAPRRPERDITDRLIPYLEGMRMDQRITPSDAAPSPRAAGLKLTRRTGEAIQIGDDITITVVKIQGGSQVRLRIQCPESIRIRRSELVEGSQ